MINTEKKKKPFVLNREQHRHIKSLSKDALTEWLRQFYCEVYNEAISETYLAVMRHLHDDNDWNNEQLEELFYNSNNDIAAINEHYVTAEEIRAGLADEGITFLKKIRLMGDKK